MLEVTGTEDKVDAFVETLRPYGVVEMGRTGRVSMTRGLDTAVGRHDAGSPPASVVSDETDTVASV